MKRIISLVTVITLLVTMMSGISVQANETANAAAEYKKTVFEENFEGETYASAKLLFGSDMEQELKTETGGNHYNRTKSSWSPMGYEFDPIKTSKFEVDFDFYKEAGNATMVFMGYRDSGNVYTSQTILFASATGELSYNGDIYGNDDDIALNGTQTKVTDGRWYSYHAELDDTARSIEITVKDKASGDVVGTATKSGIARKTAADAYRGWVKEGTEFKQLVTMFTANLDNIVIKEVHNAPTVSGVEFYDAEGSKLGDSLKRVRKINVVFDEQMDESTVTTDNVKLKNGSTAVAYSGTLLADGKTYQMVTDKNLSAGEYTLSVNNVKSELGAAIAKEYTKTFTVAGTSNVVFEENFEGEKYATPKTFFKYNMDPTQEFIKESDNNHYNKVVSSGSAVGYEFDPIKTSKFEVDFDFYKEAENATMVFMGYRDNANVYTSQTILFASADGKLSYNGDIYGNADDIALNGSQTIVENGKWYSYHAELDDTARSIEITVKDKASGDVVGTATKSGIARKTAVDAYQGWVKEGTEFKQLVTMFTANPDNIVIKEVASAPVVKTADIKTADGTVQSDKDAVSILADRIVVDFSEYMDADTLKNAVTLVKKGENGAADKNIALKSSVLKNVYTAEFSGLEKNATYEFKISTEAKTIYEIALAEAYTMTFKTQTAQFKAKLENVKIGETEVTDLAGLADGTADVNLSVLNSLDNGVATVLIIAYYNGDEMLGIKAYDVGINVGDLGTKTVEVQIAKPANTSKVKIMLWENFRTMKPLSDSLGF